MRATIWQAGIATFMVLGAQLATARAQQIATLHNFCTLGNERHCKDAYSPDGFMQDAAGNLFGVTYGAGQLQRFFAAPFMKWSAARITRHFIHFVRTR